MQPAAPRPPHLLVVDPAIVSSDEEATRDAIIAGWPGVVTVLYPSLKPGEYLDVDGIIILGSKASVTDSYDWLKLLCAWLRPFLEERTLSAPCRPLGLTAPRGPGRRVPVLGVCFGHQLLAHLLGGRVGFARPDRAKTSGLVESAFAGGRLVPAGRSLLVAAAHYEAVLELPACLACTASRPYSPFDAVEHRTLPLFGVQFHPEARAAFLAERGTDPSTAPARFWNDGLLLLLSFKALCLANRTV